MDMGVDQPGENGAVRMVEHPPAVGYIGQARLHTHDPAVVDQNGHAAIGESLAVEHPRRSYRQHALWFTPDKTGSQQSTCGADVRPAPAARGATEHPVHL